MKNLCDNCKFMKLKTTNYCMPYEYDEQGNVIYCQSYNPENLKKEDKKMQSKRDKGKQLEFWVLEQLQPIDHYARLSRASGASNDIGDVVSSAFFIECKNWNKDCVTLSMKTWNHLINQMPINTLKVPIYVYQNNKDKKFVIMDAEDFFRKVRQE